MAPLQRRAQRGVRDHVRELLICPQLREELKSFRPPNSHLRAHHSVEARNCRSGLHPKLHQQPQPVGPTAALLAAGYCGLVPL